MKPETTRLLRRKGRHLSADTATQTAAIHSLVSAHRLEKELSALWAQSSR